MAAGGTELLNRFPDRTGLCVPRLDDGQHRSVDVLGPASLLSQRRIARCVERRGDVVAYTPHRPFAKLYSEVGRPRTA